MAPRSDLSLDSVIEFKPQVGLWASSDVWSKPRQQEAQTRRKQVRFARTEKKVEYIHCTEYTPDEKEACWYQHSDYSRMRAHNRATLEKMTHRLPLHMEEECVTGLETRTPRENMVCHQRIRHAVMAVLAEQNDQMNYDGYLNDEMLAARYMSVTWESRDLALCLGTAQIVAY